MLRHGESTLNAEGRITGTLNIELTPKGRIEAVALRDRLMPPYELILSSSLRRARETLEYAMTAAGLQAPYYVDCRLNERSLGILEGENERPIPQFASGDLDFAPAGGETYREVCQRCLSLLLDLYRWSRDHKGARALLSTHMGPLRVLMAIINGVKRADRMMALNFKNTQLVTARLDLVPWPPFLED